jgi:hypothetical protein
VLRRLAAHQPIIHRVRRHWLASRQQPGVNPSHWEIGMMGKPMGVLKGILIAVALAVVGKLGLHEYPRQDATHQVIINAYREHAIAACRHRAGDTVSQAAWGQASNVRLTIGKSDLNVFLWQTNHRLWNARYRNAYLYVTVDDAKAHVYCEYDIANDMAWVYRLGQPTTQQTYTRSG